MSSSSFGPPSVFPSTPAFSVGGSTSDAARSDTPFLSVIAPALNEEQGIELFVRTVDEELSQLLRPVGKTWEIVIVDDGSRDQTPEKVRALSVQGFPVVLLQLSRNFGHQMAITAGIDAALGEVLITMDADLQHPPHHFGSMLACHEQGADVVLMRKRSSHQRESYKTALAKGFYALMARISDVPTETDVGDFRLFTREVAQAVSSCRETHRFLRGLIAWVGFRQVILDYEVAPRAAGTSKYTLARLWKLATSGFFAHSTAPLKWPLYLGIPLFLVASAYIAFGLVQFLATPQGTPRGWLSGVALMTLFSGLLFAAIGLQGAYLARLFEQAKGRPLYVLRGRSPTKPLARENTFSQPTPLHPKTAETPENPDSPPPS